MLAELAPLDLSFSLFVLLAGASLVVLYSAKTYFTGKTFHDRVTKEGSSILMPKAPMDIAYWGVEKIGNILVALKITPNQISFASLVLGIIAGYCLAYGNFGLAGLLTTLSSLMDALDGFVARATHVDSDSGEVIDATVDRYVEFFFFTGLVFFYRDMAMMMFLVLLAMVGSFMVSYSTAKAEALQLRVPRGNMRRTERAFYMTLGAVLSPISIYYLETKIGIGREPHFIAYPMAVSVAIIAVFANSSAYLRMKSLTIQLNNQQQKNKKP